MITLFAGENILASFAGARPANPASLAERQFIDVVEEMAIAAGVPTPRAMVVDTPALNAFASGYSPQRAMITATSGIIALCTREELQGVVGHEMGHVADYDVRYTTVVAAMAGVMVLLAHFLGNVAGWTFRWGGVVPYRSRGGRSDGASGIRIALTLVVLVLLAVVARGRAACRAGRANGDLAPARISRRCQLGQAHARSGGAHARAAEAGAKRNDHRAEELAGLGLVHRRAQGLAL